MSGSCCRLHRGLGVRVSGGVRRAVYGGGGVGVMVLVDAGYDEMMRGVRRMEEEGGG